MSGPRYELRRDDSGRPIGLQWPERPASEEAAAVRRLTRQYQKGTFAGVRNTNGRPREAMCSSGRHEMAVHGRERSDGDGRYCNACKNERARANNARYRAQRRAKRPADKVS